MILYTLPQEKQTLLHYAALLQDDTAKRIVEDGVIRNSEEAIHLANFFWEMVDTSNDQDQQTGNSSEYILEKTIITLMAYFRASGYEAEWEKVVDERP